MKRILLCLLMLMSLTGLALTASAEEAQELSGPELVSDYEGLDSVGFLVDGNRVRSQLVPAGTELTFTSDGGVAGLYLIFDAEYTPYTLTDVETGEAVTCGQEKFLHDFQDLAALFGRIPRTVTLTVGEQDTRIAEIRAFGPGEIPGDVQRWSWAPEGQVDLMVLSAHGDDEQLFFAGVLPDYAGQRGYETVVVYLSDHHNNSGYERRHEMLDGLWVVGVDNYPIFGGYPDYFSKTLLAAYSLYDQHDITEEEVLGFVVEQIRRYQPMVTLTHDVNGEYGHGMHRMMADLLQKAVEITMDPRKYPESAEKYGLWDVPKTYLHLYPERQIVMDWDQPLERFDGMTAYEVTKLLGFPAHESQYWDFAWYTAGFDTAAEIPKNGPCQYGLYRTTVGEDVEKNDFFENVSSHRELQEQQLEQQRLEEERLEQERQEQERREEEARRESEEAARAAEAEAAQKAAAEAQKQEDSKKQFIFLNFVAVIILALLLILVIFLRKRHKKK